MQTLKMKINTIITITINHTTEDRIQRMIMMRTTTNSNSLNTIKRDIKDLNREEITITTMNKKKKIYLSKINIKTTLRKNNSPITPLRIKNIMRKQKMFQRNKNLENLQIGTVHGGGQTLKKKTMLKKKKQEL